MQAGDELVVGAPGRADDPRVGGQVGEGDGLAAGQRVVRAEQDIQRFDVELFGVEAGVRQRRDIGGDHHHGDVGVPGGEHLEGARRFGFAQLHRQTGVPVLQAAQRQR